MKCLTDIKDNEVSLFLLTWRKFQDTLLVELGDDTTYDLKIIHSAHTFTWTHIAFIFNEHINKYVKDTMAKGKILDSYFQDSPSNYPIYWLYNLGNISEILGASVSSSVKWSCCKD